MNNKHATELKALMNGLHQDRRYIRLNDFKAHGNTTTYAHSMRVTKMSFIINEKLKLRTDKQSLIKGAMLHDYYLYDWHHQPKENTKLHGFSHAEEAMRNAQKDFGLSEKEANIIYSHMWPLNITHLPKSKEAWIVCLADKICSLQETIKR